MSMWRRGKRVEEERQRQWGEDLLKAVAHGRDLDGTWEPEQLLPAEARGQAEQVLAQLEGGALAKWKDGGWRLTQAGRARAVELLRAHRLVETYLARKRGRPAEELHAEADEVEHRMTPEGINALADLMNRPRFDPHGDPIPERLGDLRRMEQIHLKDTPEGMRAQVAHIEDEPREDFEKLDEMGLALELPLRVVQQSGRSTVIELAGERLELPTQLAARIEVIPYPQELAFPEDLRRLTCLKPGESGAVAFISPACLGPERRRLLDFGLVPGSGVSCEFISPFGSPLAYRVRGTTIALRRAQARGIFIRRTP